MCHDCDLLQYHDESTPPLPDCPRPKRSKSAHARFTLPARVNGHVIPIATIAPPPPPPAPIIAPPPPPKVAVNMASNINRINHRYSMPAKIPQSTTESVHVPPRPPRSSRDGQRDSRDRQGQTRKRGNTTPHRIAPHPPSRDSRANRSNITKKRPPKRSKSSRRRVSEKQHHQQNGHHQNPTSGSRSSARSNSRSSAPSGVHSGAHSGARSGAVLHKKRERSQSQKQRVRFLYQNEMTDSPAPLVPPVPPNVQNDVHELHDGNALRGLIGNSNVSNVNVNGHGHQYVAFHGNHFDGHCMTPTITHISQYNNFNHFNVTHYPQSAKAAANSTTQHSTHPIPINAINNINGTKAFFTPNPIEDMENANSAATYSILQQQRKMSKSMSPANAQRVPIAERWDITDMEHDGDPNPNPNAKTTTTTTNYGDSRDSVQKKRSVRKLKIIRNDYDFTDSRDIREVRGSVESQITRMDSRDLQTPPSPIPSPVPSPIPTAIRNLVTSSSASPPHRARHRQSSDPNIRSQFRSPSLPPLREHLREHSNRSKSRDRGQSMILRERGTDRNSRRLRRSKLRVIRDQRKGSDPKGLRERKLGRNRVGAHHAVHHAKSTGNRSEEEKQSEYALSALSALSTHGAASQWSRPPLLMGKMSKNCHLRFFVEMNGIWTYAVCFESNLCGLELCPIDEHESKGAVVVKCHSAFSQEMVVEGSLLIGMGNEIVLQMDHSRILKRIRCSPRPLTLTFYHFSKQQNAERRQQNEQYLCLWLASDNTMRFKSKSV